MKIICAGMPKTGTKTLCSALRILGYTVYDFEEQFMFLGKELKKALNEGCSTEEYRKIFEGVDAVTDSPACLLWEELHEAFPDAKIILTKRKDETEWCQSALNQIRVVRSKFLLRILITFSFTGRQLQDYGNAMMRIGFGLLPSSPWRRAPVNDRMAIQRYREHNSHILMAAPKDKLLDFDLKDGWKPLCNFLGVPVPSQPFPHRNKGGTIIDELMDESDMFKKVKSEVFLSLCIIFAAIACIAYLLFF